MLEATKFFEQEILNRVFDEEQNKLKVDPEDNIKIVNRGITIDGGGSVITTGYKGSIHFGFDCEILEWTLESTDDSFTVGTIQFDLRKCTYTQYDGSTHPVAGDSIVGSNPPIISSNRKAQSSTLTDWITTISANDNLWVYVTSVTSLTRVTLTLKVKKI